MSQYNKEQMKEYNKKHYLQNRDRHLGYKKKWFQNNKSEIYIRKRKQKYGITHEQLKQMFIAQEGKCAICGFKFTKSKEINIDHNHNTNQTRQLLCTPCNLGLGMFKENVLLLQKAEEYIRKWE